MRLERVIRPWAAMDGPQPVDSLVMETRDRLMNLGTFGAAAVMWILVALVVTTRDPILDPMAGVIGAGLIGLAVGLTTVPIFYLVTFGRHRRISYQGDWTRAARRGGWVAIVIGAFVILRLQSALELPIAIFILVLVAVAEATFSADR